VAVYTEVSHQEARQLLHALNLGELASLQGCASGIENTNYFVSTVRHGHTCEYVLTLFERLTATQLPFYLRLMKHLAQRGLPVPEPQADAQGHLVFDVQGKPAAVVNKLRGASQLRPSTRHCEQVGATLAHMHLAASDFELSQANLRALPWWNDTVPMVLPYLDAGQASLIRTELAFQNHLAAQSSFTTLPRGPVHADLFRDNVLFDTVECKPVLSGLIDFYFAGVDTWLYDLAVCLNDWCIDPQTQQHQAHLALSFITSYDAVRPLLMAERTLLPGLLRAAALRFWLTRLCDYYQPRAASVLQGHDPGHFERVLRLRASQPLACEFLAEVA